MTTEAHRDAFEKIMASSLERAIDFIKFAEAKNAALLTFASGCAIAIMSELIADATKLPSTPSPPTIPGLTSALSVSLVLFAITIMLTLWSLLPIRKWRIFVRDPHQPANLLYFGDISQFDAAAFRSRARERYLAQGGQTLSEDYLNDLSDQVAVNSAIADRKFTAFDRGACAALIALVVALIPWLVHFARAIAASW